jgi:hypothetical protein
MIILRILFLFLFFGSFAKQYNDIDKALVNSCKTEFEEKIESFVKKNNKYKELLEKTGLANSSAANKGLMIILAESFGNNPYMTATDFAKNGKKEFDAIRQKYNNLHSAIEAVIGDSKKMKDINFWITFDRTKSLVVFHESKNNRLKEIYESIGKKISEIRKKK